MSQEGPGPKARGRVSIPPSTPVVRVLTPSKPAGVAPSPRRAPSPVPARRVEELVRPKQQPSDASGQNDEGDVGLSTPKHSTVLLSNSHAVAWGDGEAGESGEPCGERPSSRNGDVPSGRVDGATMPLTRSSSVPKRRLLPEGLQQSRSLRDVYQPPVTEPPSDSRPWGPSTTGQGSTGAAAGAGLKLGVGQSGGAGASLSARLSGAAGLTSGLSYDPGGKEQQQPATQQRQQQGGVGRQQTRPSLVTGNDGMRPSSQLSPLKSPMVAPRASGTSLGTLTGPSAPPMRPLTPTASLLASPLGSSVGSSPRNQQVEKLVPAAILGPRRVKFFIDGELFYPEDEPTTAPPPRPLPRSLMQSQQQQQQQQQQQAAPSGAGVTVIGARPGPSLSTAGDAKPSVQVAGRGKGATALSPKPQSGVAAVGLSGRGGRAAIGT